MDLYNDQGQMGDEQTQEFLKGLLTEILPEKSGLIVAMSTQYRWWVEARLPMRREIDVRIAMYGPEIDLIKFRGEVFDLGAAYTCSSREFHLADPDFIGAAQEWIKEKWVGRMG